jgi:hypothetical protein
MAPGTTDNGKHDVTIGLDRKPIEKAGIVACSAFNFRGLVPHQIEILVGEEEACEHAKRQAMTLLDQGFQSGAVIRVGRDELHER